MEVPPPTDDAMEVRAETPEATRALGRTLATAAVSRGEGGVLVSLHGDLGAGKTMFVKGVARGLGLPADTPIVSPTFTIARSYEAKGEPIAWLHHVDAYRLRGAEELDLIGFEDMCGNDMFTCVEWGERVVQALPEDRLEVWITLSEDDAPPLPPGAEPILPRHVRLRARGPRSREVLAGLAAAVDARGCS